MENDGGFFPLKSNVFVMKLHLHSWIKYYCCCVRCDFHRRNYQQMTCNESYAMAAGC